MRDQIAHRVLMVLDPSFGNRLLSIADSRHVWLVTSGANDRARRQYWEACRDRAGGDATQIPEISGFVAQPGMSTEETCALMAEEVDAHHGPYEHDIAWTEIEVVGLEWSPQIDAVFRELGATSVVPTHDGFVCTRPPESAD
jgi:hypothetical protein